MNDIESIEADGIGEIGDIGFDAEGVSLDLFDIGGAVEPEIETRIVKPRYYKPVNEKLIKAEHANDLAASIKLEKGMRVHCVVSGNFIFSQFIRAIIMENDIKAKRVIISTLSMSQECIEALKDICDLGYCERLDLIISSYFFSHERNSLVKYIYESLDFDDAPYDFQIAVAGTHCKTVCIETEHGNKLVIHGSANLRSSGCLEQFTIEEGAELFDFHAGYADRILEVYSTIRREVRRGKLWEAVNG